MKIDYKTADAFLRTPHLSIVLLFGPDQGLVVERARTLGLTVTPDLADPFRVSELDADQLRAAPERLVEEAQALCLMGGRRLVRVRQATDTVRKALELLLELPASEAFVVIEAEDLSPGSSLRKLAESDKRVAALACYRDTERDAIGTLRILLGEHGLRVEPPAFAYLQQRVGADRGITRREIEKLALYKYGDEAPVTLAEVQEACGDSAAIGLDDIGYAALLGDSQRLAHVLDRLLGEGTAPVAILRAVMRFVTELARLRTQLEGGAGLDQVVAGRRPPLHFSVRDRFKAVLQRHDRRRLTGWLQALQQAEIGCKSTGFPDTLICRDVLTKIVVQVAEESAQRQKAPSRGRAPARP